MSDTSAALAAALKPKDGPKRIALPKQSYYVDSRQAINERLINLYAEVLPAEARAPFMLRAVPGLSSQIVLGDNVGPVRAMDLRQPDRLYMVSGDKLYRQSFELGVELVGTIPPPDATAVRLGYPVTIATGPLCSVICSPPRSFVVQHNSLGVTEITNPAYIRASSVAYLDGFFVFTRGYTSPEWFIAELLDPTSIDPLDFANADARPDAIHSVRAFKGDLWFLGLKGAEVWYNSGDADFPFRRRMGADLAVACLQPASIAEVADSLCWLGQDGVVYQSEGYAAKPISTHALESWVGRYVSPFFALGLSYKQEGHTFYVLTFTAPGDIGHTWVYDTNTKLWHERQSGPNMEARWRPSCAVMAPGYPLLGDSISGTVFAPVVGNGMDGAEAMRWQAMLPPLWADATRGFMGRLDVEMEPGGVLADTSMLLDWSDDGGFSFRAPRTLQRGAPGERSKRVFTTRLGSFRQRVLRLSGRGPVTLYGMDAVMEAGRW